VIIIDVTTASVSSFYRVLWYDAEIWSTTESLRNKVDAFDQRCVHRIVPGSVDVFNRRVPHTLDWQTWRRQLNHTDVDSVSTVKCVANVFTLPKCPSSVH